MLCNFVVVGSEVLYSVYNIHLLACSGQHAVRVTGAYVMLLQYNSTTIQWGWTIMYIFDTVLCQYAFPSIFFSVFIISDRLHTSRSQGHPPPPNPRPPITTLAHASDYCRALDTALHF